MQTCLRLPIIKAARCGHAIARQNSFNFSLLCNPQVVWSLPLSDGARRRSWAPQTASGKPPPNATDAVAVACGPRILLLGGTTATGGYSSFGHVHLFHTQQLQWSTLACSGAVPKARAGHVAAAVQHPDGWRVYVFGGGNSASGFDDLHVLDELGTRCLCAVRPVHDATSHLARVRH